MAKPWATNLLHFHLNKLFKKWFLIWHYFLATYLATFQKIGRFFPNHLVTLVGKCAQHMQSQEKSSSDDKRSSLFGVRNTSDTE